jgi:hypothetical protein
LAGAVPDVGERVHAGGMPFTVIGGIFRVVGRTAAGNPSGFEPDGDSVRFKPADPGLLKRLPVLDRPVRGNDSLIWPHLGPE